MKVLITRRMDGSCRLGDTRASHWATGYTYGEEEIKEERIFDLAEVYETETGIGWRGGSVMEHPDIVAWVRASNRRKL